MCRQPPHASSKLELRGGDGEEREVRAPCTSCGEKGGAATRAIMGETLLGISTSMMISVRH